MMNWTPISEVELWDKISEAETRMSPQLFRLWESIKITPIKWREPSYGNDGGGFWVVALLGYNAIWYNDIEEGFNRSSYQAFGEIDGYFCNQDELEIAVQGALNFIDAGVDATPRRGALVSN